MNEELKRRFTELLLNPDLPAALEAGFWPRLINISSYDLADSVKHRLQLEANAALDAEVDDIMRRWAIYPDDGGGSPAPAPSPPPAVGPAAMYGGGGMFSGGMSAGEVKPIPHTECPLIPAIPDTWSRREDRVAWVRANFTKGEQALLFRLAYEADGLRVGDCTRIEREEKAGLK